MTEIEVQNKAKLFPHPLQWVKTCNLEFKKKKSHMICMIKWCFERILEATTNILIISVVHPD